MARSFTFEQFQAWGAEGGAKSRRKLTPEQARELQARSIAARKAKKNALGAEVVAKKTRVEPQ